MSQEFDCERCGRIYLAIARNKGLAWLNYIIRETRMGRRTVKNHLQHLMDQGLVIQNGSGFYMIPKADEPTSK